MLGAQNLFFPGDEIAKVGLGFGKLALTHENLVEPEAADESIGVLGAKHSFFEPDYVAEV